MKKLPYTSCFIIVQIDKYIKKFHFDEVIDYRDYSNPDFEELKQYIGQMVLIDDKSAKDVIKEFKSIAKETCTQSSDLCVTLVVDMYMKEDGGATLQIFTLANDDKRDAFNYLAQFISDNNMKFFMKSLNTEQQDLLFDFA